MKITLGNNKSVKKDDWAKIESLPVGQYDNDRVGKTGHVFKIYPATWLKAKSIVCVTANEFQAEVEI